MACLEVFLNRAWWILVLGRLFPRPHPRERRDLRTNILAWLCCKYVLTYPMTSYLGIYGFICVTGIGFFTAALVIHVLGSARASRRIHDRLIKAVLGAPLRWLDSTPVGRIIARFTQDIRPVFTLPGAAVFAIGLWLGQVYMTAQMSVKREMSNARSPLFSHFGAALQGITSIRAYGVEDLFKTEALKRVDKYTRSGRAFYSLNRWVCIRTDALGGLFASALATYLVYYQVSVDASDTGFSLSMAVAFSGVGSHPQRV
ncbi:ATP-binding cassette transporter [Rhizoctonia solani AG-1 IA]|uniref:ATP-binding cassette transporter n=1 Tax=Thanatephorus cucumeris (strain AG1-IA) TaxID=983506 RepID=L8X889_THACA|nr:ATP-binding cassette transporter [Rhizoctonia solani AG-1 IA]